MLSVPKPCTENWANMTPDEKGRHCASCNKTVIDFSTYTDKELSEFINNNQGRICGRFKPYQLNREISVYETGNNSVWQKVMWGTALATSLAACNNGTNGATHYGRYKVLLTTETDSNKKATTIGPQEKYLTGKVTDEENGKPIKGIMVSILYLEAEVETDSAGNFKIEMPTGIPSEEVIMVFKDNRKAPQYEEKRMTINLAALPIDIEIVMGKGEKELPHIVGELAPFPNSGNHVATIMPKFKGDIDKYLAKHIVYPKALEDKGVEGTVYISFVVEKTGKISEVKVMKGVSGAPELGMAAMKAVKSMPKWIPGTISNDIARVEYTLPIKFVLDSDSSKSQK